MTLISITAIAIAVVAGTRLTAGETQRANDEIKNQANEIKLLKKQNRTLSGEVDHLMETSQTLEQIKEKVYQINKRRLSLVKWAALPDRGGNWIGRIDRYLAGSPLAGQGRVFYLAAADAGIEPRLMPAIAMIESGAGRVNANTNNFFGRRARRGYRSWVTPEEAIQNQARYVANMWGRVSSPYQMTGYATSPVWKGNVAREMARI